MYAAALEEAIGRKVNRATQYPTIPKAVAALRVAIKWLASRKPEMAKRLSDLIVGLGVPTGAASVAGIASYEDLGLVVHAAWSTFNKAYHDATTNDAARNPVAERDWAQRAYKVAQGLAELTNEIAPLAMAERHATEGIESNPTKAGPGAERAKLAKQAAAGIDKMIQALDVVRGWIKGLNLGGDDKAGAAAAALKIARTSFPDSFSEEAEFDALEWALTIAEATDELLEKRNATIDPELGRKAAEGLTRLVDGLSTLRGMLRQLKLDPVIEKIEAAIAGLKATREAIQERL